MILKSFSLYLCSLKFIFWFIRRKMAELREELEGELRTQLKRQAAAHSDHLADVLHVQEKELEAK